MAEAQAYRQLHIWSLSCPSAHEPVIYSAANEERWTARPLAPVPSSEERTMRSGALFRFLPCLVAAASGPTTRWRRSSASPTPRTFPAASAAGSTPRPAAATPPGSTRAGQDQALASLRLAHRHPADHDAGRSQHVHLHWRLPHPRRYVRRQPDLRGLQRHDGPPGQRYDPYRGRHRARREQPADRLRRRDGRDPPGPTAAVLRRLLRRSHRRRAG